MPPLCPNPPFYANGTWCGWTSQLAHINNATDPITGTVGVAFGAIPLLGQVFLGACYVILWMLFIDSPSRYKIVGITALVFVISIVMVAAGFTGNAILNFAIFGIAYVIAYLFKM